MAQHALPFFVHKKQKNDWKQRPVTTWRKGVNATIIIKQRICTLYCSAGNLRYSGIHQEGHCVYSVTELVHDLVVLLGQLKDSEIDRGYRTVQSLLRLLSYACSSLTLR